jgi:hypothetical protein
MVQLCAKYREGLQIIVELEMKNFAASEIELSLIASIKRVVLS